MKNLTIQTAIKLGFDFENAEFDSKDEMEKLIIDFLHENSDKIKSFKYDFCEVTQNGRGQHVEYMGYSCSGEIVQWSAYYGKRKQRIYHSNYLVIDEITGKCYKMMLYCYSVEKNPKK